MEILREYRQLVNKTKTVLSYDISETPMLDKMDDGNLEYIANHSNLCDDIKQIGELSELVFQLNDYVPALVNYTKIFLYLHNYDAVKEFISKLYVGHVGYANYQSKNKQYNANERLFDRFIEVVKIGNIAVELYMPLVLGAIFDDKQTIYIWHDIAMEYMQNFMRENEDELGDYIAENEKYELEYLTLILNFNTQKGISILFNDKTHAKISEEKAEYFLKTYIGDTLSYFDKHLPNDKQSRFHYIKVLAGINNNVEVDSRLENLYENEQDDEIKEFLAKRLGITEVLNFGTERHFKVLAQKKVQNVQERTLGVAFENLPLTYLSGESANNTEKTYLIDIFKEEKNLLNLNGLKSLYSIFNKESLHSFAEKLFNKLSNKDDINCAKWCVRMFSLFSNGLFERSIYEFLNVLYKLNRKKEARYLTLCLLYSQKPSLIEMFKRLKQYDSFNANFDEYVDIFASVNEVNKEEVKDLCVLDNLTDEEIEKEKKRLYLNFISGRKYSKEMFKKIFIHNKVYNEFAQHLVFGEYKQNKLYSVFVVSNKEIVYIYGNETKSVDNEVYISLVHNLDLDERFDKVDLSLNNPLFVQFNKSQLDLDSLNKSNIAFSNYQGTIVNGESFIKKLLKFGFAPNINDGEIQFDSLVCKNEILNILVEVEFEKQVTTISPTATIGNIRFYRLNQCMMDKQKYITNKAQSLNLFGINERYFDYVISSIQSAIKN